MKKYYVIGGENRYYCYGGADTLSAAKRLASRNIEYHGSHPVYPAIYRMEEVELDGNNYRPCFGAHPLATRRYGCNWIIVG